MTPRRIRENNPSYDQPLPPFISTPDEIRIAVEKSAIARGVLLIKIIGKTGIENTLAILKKIVDKYDKEEMIERCFDLEIRPEALASLDSANPPIAYPYYFSAPEMLIEYPTLVTYYRNLAMLSRKVMNGLGMNTANIENGAVPSFEAAQRFSRYFNKIVSEYILLSEVTPLRHLEIVLSNIGDGLGGVSRNEVGRLATTQIMRYVITDLHSIKQIDSVQYTLKGSLDAIEDDEELPEIADVWKFTDELDISTKLDTLEKYRVKYQQIILKNGYSLLLDRQLYWSDREGNSFKIGPDLHSRNSTIDLIWAGEIKGGADPAGSDEHWKTATQAFNRIIEAAEKTDREKPLLSFLATIIVERVAREAQQWISEGKLTSVYNLTKISENPQARRFFLDDMRRFLGID